MKINRAVLIFSLISLLLIDWAALDDITTGNEPNYFGEYLILVVSVPLLVFLLKKIRN